MIPELIERYLGWDRQVVETVWVGAVSFVTGAVSASKGIAPIRAFFKWLKTKPPEASRLCASILNALRDTSTRDSNHGTEIACLLRGFRMKVEKKYGVTAIFVEGREDTNRWDDLNKWDKARVQQAVKEFRGREHFRKLNEDTERLLGYKDKDGRFVVAIAPPVPPLQKENVL